MNLFEYQNLGECFNELRCDISMEEFFSLAEKENFSSEQVDSINILFKYLKEKKIVSTINTILKMSRLPIKNPKTFDNFDFTRIKGRDVEKLKNLRALTAIQAHKNLAFIGPAGTGKTHLAQAYGYECCKNALKTYFIKMTELRDRFTTARKLGRVASVLNGLVRPSCLIIDEVGHCEFDRENTRLFFDLIDRRYQREGCSNIIFTSNKNPSEWREDFQEDNSLLCAMDRIFDDATVFSIRGESFRGKKTEHYVLETSQVKSPELNKTNI